MIRCGMAAELDREALQALWFQCFGDDADYTRLFFDRYEIARRVFVARSAQELAAMAIWFPAVLTGGDGREYPAAYLYAVATAPAHRGRGVCRRLMAFAERQLADRGVQVVTLVPGSEELFAFYRRLGYETAFVCRQTEITVPKPGGKILPVSANRYWQLRQMLLWQNFMAYDETEIAYQKALCRHAGGDLVQLQWANQLGCAIVEPQGRRLMVKELLPPELAAQAGSALLAEFGGQSAVIRTPGAGRPFGMAKWLCRKQPLGNAYLGIAFD